MHFERILLLDDNETTIFVNTDVVEELFPNTPIISFTSSEKFIEEALKTSEWFDTPTLLLLDLNMPVKFGYEVLEELEEEIPDMDEFHVIILTSSNLMRDLERSSRFPNVIGYVEKPLTLKKLNDRLNGEI
jgi:CheY-like chemotaxis protein